MWFKIHLKFKGPLHSSPARILEILQLNNQLLVIMVLNNLLLTLLLILIYYSIFCCIIMIVVVNVLALFIYLFIEYFWAPFVVI